MPALLRFAPILAPVLIAAGLVAPAMAEDCIYSDPTQFYNKMWLCASSTLPPQGKYDYKVMNLIDDDHATAWCEGVPGDGVGQTLSVRFEDGRAEPKRILVRPGYGRTTETYYNNGRPLAFRVKLSTGAEFTQKIAMTGAWQAIDIERFSTGPESYITLMISDVAPGEKYHDTCISGLEVDFEGY
jgi:hypothetical protein